MGALARKGPVITSFLVWEFAQGGSFVWCLVWGGNFSWRLLKIVWKLEREKSKRRVHGGKDAGGEIVRDFLTKLYSNYFRAVFTSQWQLSMSATSSGSMVARNRLPINCSSMFQPRITW